MTRFIRLILFLLFSLDGLFHAAQVFLDLVLDHGDLLVERLGVRVERLLGLVHHGSVLLDGSHGLVLSCLALNLKQKTKSVVNTLPKLIVNPIDFS